MAFKHIQPENIGEATIFRLLDAKLADTLIVNELEDEILEAIDEQQPKRLVIDFTNVKLCSTAVVNGLLRARKRLATTDGRLKLCGMIEPIRDGYRILNLDGTVFEIHEDIAAALRAF